LVNKSPTSTIQVHSDSMCTITTTGTFFIQIMSQIFDTQINNQNFYKYNKNMKYSLLSIAAFNIVSKWGFSSSSTSSVLTLIAFIATLNESERKKKMYIKIYIFK